MGTTGGIKSQTIFQFKKKNQVIKRQGTDHMYN